MTSNTNPFIKEALKVSLLTPVYGDDWKHLDKWLQSLKNQEYPHIEAIIVFDGPNKEGQKHLAKLLKSKKYKGLDVQVFDKEHGGKASTINFAFEKSTGDILSCLDSDSFLLPETVRLWANEFENQKINRVWSYYSIEDGKGNSIPVGGGVPRLPNGKPDYWAVQFSPYIDSASPIRRSAWVRWDTTVKSLIDWEWSLRLLKRTNFVGDDHVYLDRSLFVTSPVDIDGISADSHQNWVERTKYVKKLNNIPLCDSVVTSLGAVHHGLHVAKKLGWDFMPMPSFKDHEYKTVYLLGFYPEATRGTKQHLQVFAKTSVEPRLSSDSLHLEDYNPNTKKIIHWIGTDILKMRSEVPFLTIQGLNNVWKALGVVHLCECKWIQKELEEIGIKARIVPIPPKKLWQESLPLPEEFTVGVYESEAQDDQMYNIALMLEVAVSMPDIKFYFFGEESRKGMKNKNMEHMGYTDMEKLMPKMSCNLRITTHDGMPLLPIEFLSAGRNVITNLPMGHGVIEVENDRKQIVEAIRKAQREPLNPKYSKYWRKEMSFKKYKKTMEKI